MKTNGSRRLFWPVCTAAAAAVCVLTRLWQLRAAFEGELNLPISMALPSVVLTALYLLCAAALFLLCRRQPVEHTLRRNPGLALSAGGDTLFLGALLCAAFLSLIAAPVLLREGYQLWSAYRAARVYDSAPGGNNGVLTMLCGITALLSFAGLLTTAKSGYRNLERGRQGVLLSAISGCVWLMDAYRSHAANPVLWDYAPLLLAIVSGILMFLDWAGVWAGAFAPRRLLWTAGMTVILSASALAGGWTLGSALLLCAQMIAALAILWRVPENLGYPPEPAAQTDSDEEKLEEEPNE